MSDCSEILAENERLRAALSEAQAAWKRDNAKGREFVARAAAAEAGLREARRLLAEAVRRSEETALAMDDAREFLEDGPSPGDLTDERTALARPAEAGAVPDELAAEEAEVADEARLTSVEAVAKQCHPECPAAGTVVGLCPSEDCRGIVTSDGDGTFTCDTCKLDIHGPRDFSGQFAPASAVRSKGGGR